jgi:hypothetical protein
MHSEPIILTLVLLLCVIDTKEILTVISLFGG